MLIKESILLKIYLLFRIFFFFLFIFSIIFLLPCHTSANSIVSSCLHSPSSSFISCFFVFSPSSSIFSDSLSFPFFIFFHAISKEPQAFPFTTCTSHTSLTARGARVAPRINPKLKKSISFFVIQKNVFEKRKSKGIPTRSAEISSTSSHSPRLLEILFEILTISSLKEHLLSS